MRIPFAVVMTLAIAFVATITFLTAFLPTYLTGMESVQSTVESVRLSAVARSVEGINSFFAKFSSLMDSIRELQSLNKVPFGNYTEQELVDFSCGIVFSDDSIASCFFPMPYARKMPFCLNFAPGVIIGGAYNDTSGRLVLYLRDRVTKKQVMPPRTLLDIPFYISGVTSMRAFHQIVEQTKKWSDPYPGLDSAQFTTGTNITDPLGFQGAMGVDIRPEQLAVLLNSLGLRAKARALIFHPGRNIVLSTNFEQKLQTLYANWLNITAPEETRMKLLPLGEVGDRLIQEAIGHLGGEQQALTGPTPMSTKMGSGKGTVYVDLHSIELEGGLSLRVLIVMPEEDFTEDVYKSRNVTLFIVFGVLVLLLMIGVIFSLLLARPLHRLGERMEKTAQLQDDDEDESLSMLGEVADMQNSYLKMKSELNRVKKYLPQSVINAGDNEDDEGDVIVSENASATSGGSKKAGGLDSQSTASGRTVSTERAGAAKAALNISDKCFSKRIAVVMFNLIGFLGMEYTHVSEVKTVQSHMLDAIYRAVMENKGVVDFFQGDHCVATFNAVNSIASFSKRAVIAAMAAIKSISSNGAIPLKATAGVANGTALVGNMGTTEMQRFNVIGYPYLRAMMLERMAKLYNGVSVLADSRTVADVELEMYRQAVGIAILPASQPKPQVISSIKGKKETDTDEWMYELQQGQERDPFVHCNAAFDALIEGNVSSATEHLQVAIEKSAAKKDANELWNCAAGIDQVKRLIQKFKDVHGNSSGPTVAECVEQIARNPTAGWLEGR